jgi:hypothetical protein
MLAPRSARAEIARGTRGSFNLIHHATQFKADVYLAGDDPLHAWALEHRRRIDLGDAQIWIAPPEYVVLRKLEFLRESGQDKHLRDIRFMLAVTPVELAFVGREVSRLGVEEEWRRCRGGGVNRSAAVDCYRRSNSEATSGLVSLRSRARRACSSIRRARGC